MSPRVVIVGGGISGLAAAYELVKRGVRPIVLEASSRFGGNIRTHARDGFVIEEGPDSWVAQKPQVAVLAKELGLGDDLVETLPENRKTYIRKHGKLVDLPDGLVLGIPTKLAPLVSTPLISWPGKFRAALDLIAPPGFMRKSDGDDESVAEFIERRLGREVLEQIAGPLLGGLFTGNVHDLSLMGTFPQLAALENQGGLVRGALAQARKAPPRPADAPKASPFVSLKRGLGTLVDALVARLSDPGDVLRPDQAVVSLERRAGGGFVVHAGGGSHEADHVLLTGPTTGAARLLRGFLDDLVELLDEIPCGSAATAFLGYRRQDVPHALDATGYLIPRGESEVGAMASTFVSSKWPNRAPDGQVLLRVFFGGVHVERDDDDLVERARTELRQTVGVTAEPTLRHVGRFRQSSPQPRVGQPARLRKVEAILAGNPGLHLVGSAYEGVGMGDCVRRAQAVVGGILG